MLTELLQRQTGLEKKFEALEQGEVSVPHHAACWGGTGPHHCPDLGSTAESPWRFAALAAAPDSATEEGAALHMHFSLR